MKLATLAAALVVAAVALIAVESASAQGYGGFQQSYSTGYGCRPAPYCPPQFCPPQYGRPYCPPSFQPNCFPPRPQPWCGTGMQRPNYGYGGGFGGGYGNP
ncbi:hypothetical protein ETAA8_41780 [Anatilimnocola aggregata]|uniref:Uncharacterized protein n=1 Tax=Anatilimnocola aggregata TaxID=2528021 RepID=A0A517YFU0_9BACT|nr:hypothetical protein [Anatilimnocola aggregata]QDU29071.1 hypothetical protein ETAA8_41780 [Anatilimnocola aggregata]